MTQSLAHSGPIAEALVALVAVQGWEVEPLPEGDGLVWEMEGEWGNWTSYALARDELGYFVCYSLSPLNAPPDRLGAAAELVCRANDGMLTGNFELRMSDGRIRYKTAIDFGDIPEEDLGPTGVLSALVTDLVVTNLTTFDRYLPALHAVLLDGESPEQAVSRVECA